MKSYTDIVQSKKLAEILPIESADMCYRAYREVGGIPDYQATLCPYQFASWVGIPCWSLAALLKVLLCPSLCNTFGEWRCQCYKEDHIVATSYADNPVDACVEMILKLKEKNLL